MYLRRRTRVISTGLIGDLRAICHSRKLKSHRSYRFSWTVIVKRENVLKGMHFPKWLQLSLQRIRAALNEIWGWEKCNDKPHICATSGRCIVILISNRMILYLALWIQLFRNLRHAMKACFLNFYSVFHCYYFFTQIFSCKHIFITKTLYFLNTSISFL